MHRRQLLKLSACGASLSAVLPLAGARARAREAGFAFAEVRDPGAPPLLRRGDFLLADTRQAVFGGEGLYLYPDWGRPGAYLVREGAAGELLFFKPGQARALWSMPARAARFAGRVEAALAAEDERGIARLHVRYPELKVPELPPG